VAYTFVAGLGLAQPALAALRRDVYPVGRYARWIFQGIADSIRDGLFVGGALRDAHPE
jgi:hypothetical protein